MRRIVCAMAFLLLSCVFGAAAPRTLRVDYYRTGNVHEEWFSLDRIVLEPLEWPGNPHHVIDQSQLGIYLFEVRETSSGKLLYSRGFNSVFGEWTRVLLGEGHFERPFDVRSERKPRIA